MSKAAQIREQEAQDDLLGNQLSHLSGWGREGEGPEACFQANEM